MTTSSELAAGTIAATLSSREILHVDYVILATGYRADLARVPYLAGVLDHIQLTDGFPILDQHFQTTVPGLFITGFAATRDFGPFFGFVRGSTAAATIIAAGPIGSEPARDGVRPVRPPARERHGAIPPPRHTATKRAELAS